MKNKDFVEFNQLSASFFLTLVFPQGFAGHNSLPADVHKVPTYAQL